MNGDGNKPAVQRAPSRREPRFSYGDAEAAIQEVLAIKREEMAALRGRLRFLRSSGLPSKLPRPGSGKKIDYKYSQVFEMLIAVALERNGMTPAYAIMAAKLIAETGLPQVASMVRHSIDPETGLPWTEFFALVIPHNPSDAIENPYHEEGDVSRGIACQYAESYEDLLAKLKGNDLYPRFQAAFFLDLKTLAHALEDALLRGGGS